MIIIYNWIIVKFLLILLYYLFFMDFAKNLRSEMDYQDLIAKQIAEKAGISINTLNHYLSGRKSMPPADVALKIAKALGVSVEFLVMGKETTDSIDMSKYMPIRHLMDDLLALPEDLFLSITAMIRTARSACGEGRQNEDADG